jgi:hypothetical protein
MSEVIEIDRHLRVCPPVRGNLRARMRCAAVKKHATYFAAPAHLERRIQAALPRATARPEARAEWTWRWNWLSVGPALASVFALVWVSGSTWRALGR